MTELTFEQVSMLLRYDPKTGRLFWLSRDPSMFTNQARCNIWNAKCAGKEAMTAISGNGYRQGKIFGKLFQSHRVCWLLQHGSWPTGVIDHIDGDKLNNAAGNLRDVNAIENSRNCCLKKNNSSGVNGVRRKGRKWQARIMVDRVLITIGAFNSIAEAEAARLKANSRYHYSSRHGADPAQ